MANVALWDLVSPYFLLGNALGNVHAALAVLAVEEYEQASDLSGTVIRGLGRFHGDIEPWFDPGTLSFGIRAENIEGHPRYDPSRRNPWFDLRDTSVDFQLFAPRVGSALVAAGHAPIDNPQQGTPFAPTDAVLDALDALPVNAPFSDYPSTEFTLDLVLNAPVLRPPFLRPARMRSNGLLEPDPDRQEVTLTLPRVKLRFTQGSDATTQPRFQLLSFGARGLDDPGDPGVAQLVTMDPPYAFIGPGQVVGFGFRSAVLDLSDGSTPPEVLEQFGFDQSWTGVYFPEIRLYVATQGAEGWAVNAGARNLLLGIGASAGVTGDFELDVINQGGALRLGARFYAPGGRAIGLRRIDATHASVVLPKQSTMVVDVEGGRPPYFTKITLDGGAPTAKRVATIDLSAQPTRTIDVSVSATADGPPVSQLKIQAQREDRSGGSGSITVLGNVPAASVTHTETTRNGAMVDGPRLVIHSQSDITVTVRLEDNAEADWTVGGDALPKGRTATFELLPGTSKTVVATVAGTTTQAPIYFHYDEPDQMTDAQLTQYALNPELTRTSESLDEMIEHGWTGGVPVLVSSEHHDALRSFDPGDNVVIVGHASWEGDASKAEYNRLLSNRRAKVARVLYDELAGPSLLKFTLVPKGFTDAEPAQTSDPGNNPRRRWWRAELQNAVSVAGPVTTGTVERPPVPSSTIPGTPAPVDPPPETPPEPPGFLRSIGARVRIIRDDFIAVELHGEVDFDTVAEQALRGPLGPNTPAPTFSGLGHQNPGDGIVRFRGMFTRNPGSDEWALDVLFGADPSDVDGLLYTGTLPGEDPEPQGQVPTGRNLLGLYALFLPLLADVSPEKPGSAEVTDLALQGAALALPAALTATGWFTVERVVWYGGEVLVRQHNGQWTVAILADVETAVSADIELGGLRLLTIDRQQPLVARYKAIGVRFGQDPNGELIFHPVFDSSKGYTLDLARPGSLTVADPLGQALRVEGARVSRTNPSRLEVELGSAVDLGVVALERCAVRMDLSAVPPTVELTALGVAVDIPGVLAGSGYLAVSQHGFAGRLDLTLVPLRLRIAGALRVEHIDEQAGGPATAVAVTLEIQFPVAIPLWSSGLGLYGLIGLFAMHFTRNEANDAASATPALAWLKRSGGDPTQIQNKELWTPEIDHWAFGVGAIVGTLGSSIVFNMKGVVLLELPGPRLLLMMKANVLYPMPKLKDEAEGTLLAVLDLDAGRETLTIALVIDFTIDPILEIHIPIEAFFNGKQPEDWHLFLGQYSDQIRASIFGVFSGSGYLMLVGSGDDPNIEFHPDLPVPDGFAISTGLHVSMVWGSKSVGLYAELAAGFDAILGFSPLLVAGVLYARGELRLFIISISASATLNVRLGEVPGGDSGYEISGEVCGSIDLFFFEIEGCVNFAISDNEPPDIIIPTLVSGVSLVSRSPALVHGTAADEPPDAALADAIEAGAQPNADDLPNVPINAIPVVMFSAPPMDGGVQFLGADLGGSSGGREIQRSSDRMTYTLTKVELIGPLAEGPKPATWWTLRPPDEANESAQLALLSWIPNPTPKAIQASKELTQTVEDRWGTVCFPGAPPTSVLWTFRYEPLGPSTSGWKVDGEPWPDPPDTVRSVPPPTKLDVWERWRCGNPVVDPFRGILPAEVVGALVNCPREEEAPDDDLPALTGPRFLSAGQRAVGTKLPEVIDEPSISATELRRRLEAGVPISRAALSTVVAEPPVRSAVAVLEEQCESRILAGPRFDTLAPPTGDPIRQADIAARWKLLGFDPGDLADGVVLQPGVFDTARLLLFVSRRVLGGPLVVRSMTPDGEVVSETVVGDSMAVSWVTLPSTWVDPAGPWDDDLTLVMNHQLILHPQQQYAAVLVDVHGDVRADRILIGLRPEGLRDLELELPAPAYYVAALEVLHAAEIGRYDHDSHEATKNHEVLEASLGSESGNVALMTPDTTYQVKVTWSATASNAAGDTANLEDQVQSFWFHTTTEAPDRLDPWILACLPYEGERHVFGHEPLQIVFATHDLLDLFGAYGYRLEVRLSAASARPPEDNVIGIDYPIVLGDLSEAVAGGVFSPWERTAVAVVDPDCVEIDEERIRHSVVTIPVALDPAADYLLDIWRVPEGSGGTDARVYRRSFATSAFPTLAAYAEFCRGSRVTHRSVPAGLAAKVKAAFGAADPEGEQLDNVLRGNVVPPHPGIEPLPVPDKPRIVVWWEGAGIPAPTAVAIDGTEPLWRSRERPEEVTFAGTGVVTHWELRRDDWVLPVEAAGSHDVVDHIVRAPGGQRAIVLLKAGSRGKRLKLALRRRAFDETFLDGPNATDHDELLADMAFLKAPWEED